MIGKEVTSTAETESKDNRHRQGDGQDRLQA